MNHQRVEEAAEPEILGRLLSAMPVLEVLPTEGRIEEFLTSLLRDVPGVAECEVFLQSPEASPNEARHFGDSRGWTLPLESSGHGYGALLFKVEDEGVLSRYRPFLENLATSVALLLENRWRRDRLQEALGELETRGKEYRSLFENMPGGCAYCRMIYDERQHPADFVYLAVNAAFGELTGLKDVVGRLVTEVIPGIKESSPGLLETYGRVALTGRPEHFELDLPALDMILWISVYSPAKEHFVTVFDNITERKRAAEHVAASELRYRRLFEAARDGILILDAVTGAVVDVNPFMEELLGYSREEFIGTLLWELGCFRNALASKIKFEELQRTEYVRYEDLPLETKDGRLVAVEFVSNVYEVDHQKVIQCNIRDISERKQAADGLRASEERLRESQKMEAVGQLAGGIAHDFNNLLTAVLGYSELLLAGPELAGSAAREDVEEIRRAAERGAALTRQILAFSRRQDLRPDVVSLNQVLVGMEPLLRRTLGENMDLISLQHPDLGHVEVDVHQFEQVLMNLALNARDAMPTGGRLTLETANVELDENYCSAHPEVTPGHYVMLAVSDTGIGMDEATRGQVFEPFFTTKAPGQGTGLGLATVHGIVKQSGGSIFVYSEPGKGTTFKIYLPRVEEHETAETVVPPRPVASTGDETVMVVEDESSIRSLIERVLGVAGYQVISFATADEATVALEQGEASPDLLLTDAVLPGVLQGKDLVRRVQDSRPDFPCVYMSGYTRDAIVHAGRLDEGADFLEKPFTPETLATMVRTVLDRPRGSG